MVLAVAGWAMAQSYAPNQTQDILGAHNNNGRGCVMCHAPHSGVLGNGAGVSGDPQNGEEALWGQNLTPLYGQTLQFGNGGFPVTLPSILTETGTVWATPGTNGTANGLTGLNSPFNAETIVMFCLSCHDGVLAKGAMMKGQTVEALPVVGGTAPTWLAAAKPAAGLAYNNDHPVGPSATYTCGGNNWDCTGGGATTAITAVGPNQLLYMQHYPASLWNTSGTAGFKAPFSTSATGIKNVVTCTTCHNQHSMTAFSTSTNFSSTVTSYTFSTMFFIKGYYNPTATSNSVAQFCRNCHASVSNELNGAMSVVTQ